jgi:prepilin-type N-terminal cleavage/methylation domain-containing protein
MNLGNRNRSGFTIVEMIVVLLLLSIIAATVLGRAVSTKNIDLTSQMDRVRNHFRYAHSMAMKHGDAVWGFKCDGDSPREYWVFRIDPPIADHLNEPNLPANQVILPGEQDSKVNLTARNVTMVKFVIFFDRFGRPYLIYKDEGDAGNIPLPNNLSVSIFATDYPGEPRFFEIIKETGIMR